jgi:class 3 adenylate cyclase
MSTPAQHVPLHRAMVAVDIEGSTTRTNPARAQLRAVLFELLDEAFLAGGITKKHRDAFVDRGDGALCLVRPVDQAPKPVLLATVVPALTELLEKHAESRPELAFRLRVAVHAGEVHYDDRGPYGEDIDIVCRFVDAPELRRRLRITAAPLVLVVSQEMYRSVVRHGYPGIDHDAFAQAVPVRVGTQRLRGWIHTPEAARSQEDMTA